MITWTSLYPQWLTSEQRSLSRSYPEFRVDERYLHQGVLRYFGELVVRPSGGAQRFPVRVTFPDATPFALPIVTPLHGLPEFDESGLAVDSGTPRFFDHRHQMAEGSLCLFQQDTRGAEGGETIGVVDVLRRAQAWLFGHLTGNWPPDSQDSELESHFNIEGFVLLSSVFYAQEVAGHGRFYMVRDMRRILDPTATEAPPLLVTIVTTISDGQIETPYDARAELKRPFPWIGNSAWSIDEITELQNQKNKQEYVDLFTEHGYWWSLPEEPRPFRDGIGLLEILANVAPNGDAFSMVSNTMGSDLTTESKHFFGLKYPGRHGDDEWLIVTLRCPGETPSAAGGIVIPDEHTKRSNFENGSIACYRVQGARPEEIQLRNSTVVDSAVREKTVALIGLGALGSKVAELLAQAGVGAFRLCDGDRLSVGNVARHTGGLSDFGEKKTRVVVNRIHNINPHLKKTICHAKSATGSISALQTFIEPADLVICTTADENAESAINQVAIVNEKPVIYGRAMRRGSMGRVFLVRPGTDACKRCIGLHAAGSSNENQEAAADWIAVEERPEDVLLHECGRPVIPSSAIDLSFVASLVARQALSFLEGRIEEQNHWVWSQDPAPEVDVRLDRLLATVQGSIPQWPDCPSCSSSGTSKTLLSADVVTFVTDEVTQNPDVETGGVLFGFVADGTAHVTRAIGPGPKAIKTPTRFEKDVDFAQAELERANNELGEKGQYLGEWHSHLVPDPVPSGQDIGSMTGIAESENYTTLCPIMLIAGYDKDLATVAKLKAWAFPISHRVIELEIVADEPEV